MANGIESAKELPPEKYLIATPTGWRPATDEEKRKSLEEKLLGFKPDEVRSYDHTSFGRSGRGY